MPGISGQQELRMGAELPALQTLPGPSVLGEAGEAPPRGPALFHLPGENYI